MKMETNKKCWDNFTYTRQSNTKQKNKQNRLIDTENILIVARWEGSGGMGEKGEGIKKYTLVITE